MEDLTFTNEAISGLATEGILMIILPVVLLIIWKVKTKEKLLPVIVGAVTWFVFAILLKLAPAYFLLQADNPLAKTISGNIWYTMIAAGLLAGVFEETGRFIAFKTVLKKYEHRRASLSYGIGHGGFESVYIGFQMLMTAVMGIMVSSGQTEQLTGTMDEAAKAAFAAQMEMYAGTTFGSAMLGAYERIPAITGHIAFSVLVFAAARDKKYLYLYPLAVVLHALFDFSIVFYSAQIIPLWTMELVITVFAAATAFFSYRLLKK